MGKRRNQKEIIQNLEVTGYAAEGKALAKLDGKVIFIENAVPGDVADVMITRNKKDWAEGRVLSIITPSSQRVVPFCKHFGICGGCKWQMLPYAKQLEYKQQEAEQNLRRIGKLDGFLMMPIIEATQTRQYRNKLEFTASNKEFLAQPATKKDNPAEKLEFIPAHAIGFHVPRIFDKVVNITECHLMDDINNSIRNTVRDYAKAKNILFYDARQHTGWLRNIIIRYCTTTELMVNVVVNYEDAQEIKLLLDHLLQNVKGITTLLYTVNSKWNDSLYDQEPITYFGPGYVKEKLEDLVFIISPKSFFQTNTRQAETLYRITRDFAGLTGNEIVYDLYCGTGSIGLFVSKYAKKVIGVELIEEAIADAKKNAALNNIAHAAFFAGDVIEICDTHFFEKQGKPDVIITDPPRAGMHEKLVSKLLEIAAPRIVYVSCNTATQARDIALLHEKYILEKIQPVDMFPHTHHIESVALLTLRQ